MRSAKSSLRGFTLVELLVVMAIMSVLIGISVAGLGYAMRRSRNIARQASVANLDRALESYYSDHQQYPMSSGVVNVPADIQDLIENANFLDPYLEGSWEAPPKTCVAFISDGVRYTTGANQEVANGFADCYWAGPGLNYDPANFPATEITDSCLGLPLVMNQHLDTSNPPLWQNGCPDPAMFDWN